MPDTMAAASSLGAPGVGTTQQVDRVGTTQQVDVAVVGAGFAGLYLLHRLRKAGFTTVVLEEADEGVAYAEALAAAGVPVEQLKARGHFHSSLTMVDMVITGVGARVQMAETLRRFAGLERRQDNEAARSASPHEIAAE